MYRKGLTQCAFKSKIKTICTDPEHEDFETIVQDVYLGTIPYMTPSGTFVLMVLNVLLFLSYIDLQGFLWTVFSC
jgi:hypothetical protein